jgi:hypothetical protein
VARNQNAFVKLLPAGESRSQATTLGEREFGNGGIGSTGYATIGTLPLRWDDTACNLVNLDLVEQLADWPQSSFRRRRAVS